VYYTFLRVIAKSGLVAYGLMALWPCGLIDLGEGSITPKKGVRISKSLANSLDFKILQLEA